MPQRSAAAGEAPWLARLLGKFVLDILPGALASLIGTFLLAQYQFAHQAALPVGQQASQASAATMARLRDEHDLVMGYLKSRMAAEQSRDAAEDAENARAAAATKLAAAEPAKAAAPRPKPHVAAVPHAPLVIAQVQADQNTTASSAGRLAHDPDSLIAKTLDFKDHVVDATRHVVVLIGDMFASVGERIGQAMPGARQYSSPS